MIAQTRQAESAKGREIAETRVRYVYCCVHMVLRREGRKINPKLAYHLYIGSKEPRSGISRGRPPAPEQDAKATGEGEAPRSPFSKLFRVN